MVILAVIIHNISYGDGTTAAGSTRTTNRTSGYACDTPWGIQVLTNVYLSTL
jgi:hypothetical protein